LIDEGLFEPRQKDRTLLQLAMLLSVAFGASTIRSWLIALGYISDAVGAWPWHEGTASAAVENLVALLLVLFLIVKDGGKFADFGFTWQWRTLAYAFALWLGITLTQASIAVIVSLSGWATDAVTQASRGSGLSGETSAFLLIPYVVVTATLEEVLVRAYLMTRLSDLVWSKICVICASCAIQASYHVHHGVQLIGSVLAFLLFSIYFLWRRDVWALIIAHAGYNSFNIYVR
jgi:membrane protease YdiL (CAAX protease family)